MRDAFDNPVTTERTETRDAVDLYTAEWIGYGRHLRSVFAAADADPDCAYLQACAASVHMALEAKEGFAAAQPYLARMRKRAAFTNAREQLTIAAVEAWAMGETRIALAVYRDLVSRFPADISAAKWGQYHAFNLGDAVSMKILADSIMPAHGATGEAWGMLAFAEEQCHRVGAAEEAAMRAMALKPTDPWTHHALAHVFETQDRVAEGVAFLTAHAPAWDDRSIFVRGHNWWHLAQLHVDRDHHAEALKIYDQRIWGIWPEFAQEQIGATSALWRLELAGIDVGGRWAAVADKIAARGREHILPFHDLHFVYALARGGYRTETADFLRSLAHHAAEATESVWSVVALPVAQAVAAHARGDHARAAMLLLPMLGNFHRLGGSHAQRDVLIRTWIDAAMRSGSSADVEAFLATRVPSRAGIGSMKRFLRRIQKLHRTSRFLRAA